MTSATVDHRTAATGADGEADVEFRAVTKRFGPLVAVNAVNLRVHKGEFLSLLGPSGCVRRSRVITPGEEKGGLGAMLGLG